MKKAVFEQFCTVPNRRKCYAEPPSIPRAVAPETLEPLFQPKSRKEKFSMLSGKYFKLTRPTVGMQHIDGAATLVTIPADGRIRVLSGPNGSERDKGLVYVVWEDRRIALFAVDVSARGIEIRDPDRQYQSRNIATA